MIAALALWTGPAAAQAPAQTPSPVVLMLPDLDDDRDERAEATIAAHLQDAGIELLVRRYEPTSFELGELGAHSDGQLDGTDGAGILWVDLGRDFAVYVLVRGDSQIHGRRIDRRDLGDAVAFESLANVSATAAIAVAEGRPIVLQESAPLEPAPREPEASEPTSEAPAPEGPAPEEPAPTERVRLEPQIEVEGVVIPKLEVRARLRVGYRGQSFASGLPWLSAAEIALGWRPVPQAHLELAYEASTPISVAAPNAGLELQLFRAPVSIIGGHRFELDRGYGLEIAGRLGLEPTRRQTIVVGELLEPGPGLEAAPPRWRVMAAAGVDVRGTVAVRDDVRLWISLGVLGVFVRNDFIVADVHPPLLSPSAIRVTTGIGVDVDFIRR